MRQDYPKIRRAGAELVIISPDSSEQSRRYGIEKFGQELPFLFVSDPGWEIARRYGWLREEEHPHGGFWSRSLWVLNREATITHRALPWNVSTQNGQVTEEQLAAYQLLFSWIGAEPGDYVPFCPPGSRSEPQP